MTDMEPSLTTVTREQLMQLDKEQLVEMLLSALARIERLEQIVAQQNIRIQELEDQLAKNSQNSGKPPSSDGLKKPKTKSLRRPTGRGKGGQKGHQGHTLEMVAEPNYQETYPVTSCPHCAENLSDIAVIGYEKRQVFDLPPVEIEVSEHRVEVKRCPQCHREAKGDFPADVSATVQYGPRLKAQAVYLNQYQLLPWARTCEALGDLYNHQPAEALIQEANRLCQTNIEPSLAQIKEALIAADVAHFDETGIRVEGKLYWLHGAGTDQLTYYAVHAKRGQIGMKAMGILPQFTGRAIHDHLKSYFQFTNCLHGLCNAHHLRELQFIVDQYQQEWAKQIIDLLLTIKNAVDNALETNRSLSPYRCRQFSQQYDAILADGFQANPLPESTAKKGRPKQPPAKNLLDRLQKFKLQVLAFMYDFRVPFTNNLAERDVRMVKVKQKVSGSFRTMAGAETFCAIRSYISTVRKHDFNVIDAIFIALCGSPFMLAPVEGAT